ncbi:YHYH protein [Neorhodopirellula pilleata]|uniref:YHYH domain-containing protein n=1 Tax=Neorhodopirellula pilleata TaxID=2714738 RepID=A0A5C6APL6_9BACT|nr:YHYH protein [Neorhodopirellula pilleata]TWU01935.1 hypothetical protein Pla100_16710 [Neorhodopirellula pilleata]
MSDSNHQSKTLLILVLIGVLGVITITVAQPPPMRTHRVIQKGELEPLPATATPDVANAVTIRVEGDQRVITSNGIPDHPTGQFPNRGNPNRIAVQSHKYRVPAKPTAADQITPMRGEFGVAINGVPFDPGAAEFYDGDPGWQYEPLSGAINLGIDLSHAHVQPNGKYHYHGLPTGLLDNVDLNPNQHSPLIGWAADGFPIYAVYGFSNPKDGSSDVRAMTSSHQLRKGKRPGGDAPGGEYDGTFVRDYEYVEGSGDLDQCNGRFTVTPEFPEGTYAYFMTEQWPVVPRFYRGTPSPDFMHGPPGGGPGGGFLGDHRSGPGGERPRREDRPGMEERAMRGPGPGGPGPGGPPRPGTILPDFLKEALELTQDQRRRLDQLQRTVDQELAEILTEEQRRHLDRPPRR